MWWKKKRYGACVTFFLILTVSLPLYAGDPPPHQPGAEEATAEKALILSELVAEALEKNPEIIAARQRWAAAQERIPQARALEDPSLVITQWRIPDNFDIGRQGETWYGLEQAFPFPGKLRLKGQMAAAEADAGGQDYRAKVLDITAKVKETYYQLFLMHQMIRLHLEHETLLEEFIEIADARYAVGLATQQDSLKAHVELSKLHNSLVVVEQEKETTEVLLRTLLNRSPDGPLGIPAEVPYRGVTLSLEELQTRALDRRPEIKAAALMLESRKKARSLARKNYLPDFMMGVMFWDVHDGPNQWQVDTKVSIPWVFASKYNAGVREAAAGEQEALAEYERARLQTLFEIKDLFVKVATAQHLIESYQGGILPQAEQALEAARIGYQAGKVDFLSLIDSERMLRDFQLEYYETLARFEQRLAGLERAMGEEIRKEARQ